jgi:hypothetical protein
VEAAAAAVDKLALRAARAVLAAAVLVQVAQTRNRTEPLEQRTPVAVAEVVADRQAAPAVRES